MGAASSKTKTGFSVNTDRYRSYDELRTAMHKNRLECARVVVAVDFTASNVSKGRAYNRRSLHSPQNLDGYPGPSEYERVLQLVQGSIPIFESHEHIVFVSLGFRELEIDYIPVSDLLQFYRRQALRFEDIVDRQEQALLAFAREKGIVGAPASARPGTVTAQGVDPGTSTRILSSLSAERELASSPVMNELRGESSMAPAIYKTIEETVARKEYHLLIMLTDGDIADVSRDAQAVVDASYFPISIVTIGVGTSIKEDRVLETFDDVLFERRFDNFNYLPFRTLGEQLGQKEATWENFSYVAYSECPAQYRTMRSLSYFE